MNNTHFIIKLRGIHALKFITGWNNVRRHEIVDEDEATHLPTRGDCVYIAEAYGLKPDTYEIVPHLQPASL
jgi:hypothetical protein